MYLIMRDEIEAIWIVQADEDREHKSIVSPPTSHTNISNRVIKFVTRLCIDANLVMRRSIPNLYEISIAANIGLLIGNRRNWRVSY